MTNCVSVSVVIPTYNAGEFLVEAIDSVRAQTLAVAEVIVVDDGSADGSAAVAERLGATVIRQANRGVSAARNVGVRAATSEWIAFLDQDDIWAPEKIARQWNAIQLHPDVGIVSCRMTWFEPDAPQDGVVETGNDRDSDVSDEKDTNATIKYLPRPQDGLPLCRTTDNPSSVLIRRDLLLSVGLFDEGLRQNEDLECFLRLITRCPLAIVDQSLIQHRVHSGSRSQDALESGLSFIKVVDKLNAEPQRYPPGAAEAYATYLVRMLVPLGRSLLNEGRARDARALFRRSLKQQYSTRAMLFWLLTFPGPAIFKGLLSTKSKLAVSVARLSRRSIVNSAR